MKAGQPKPREDHMGNTLASEVDKVYSAWVALEPKPKFLRWEDVENFVNTHASKKYDGQKLIDLCNGFGHEVNCWHIRESWK